MIKYQSLFSWFCICNRFFNLLVLYKVFILQWMSQINNDLKCLSNGPFSSVSCSWFFRGKLSDRKRAAMGKFPHKWNFLVTIFELGFWTCSLIFILPPYNYFLVLQYYSKTNFNWLCNNPTFSKSGWIFDCDNFAVVSSRGWLHIRCTPGKSKCICSLSFSIKKWKLNFVYSYKGTRYPWRADSVLDRAQNHSLRAASGSRAHLSRPAWNKGQFKIAFFLHAQKSTDHILLKLSLSHFSFLPWTHNVPTRTRSHHGWMEFTRKYEPQ